MKTKRYDNHYNYLDDHLDLFWIKVFGRNLDDSWCGGIISAHGDKGRGYSWKWENAGIPFNHGMMLFMLSYTKIMDKPKHHTGQWVVDNYSKYLPIIQEVENEISN